MEKRALYQSKACRKFKPRQSAGTTERSLSREFLSPHSASPYNRSPNDTVANEPSHFEFFFFFFFSLPKYRVSLSHIVLRSSSFVAYCCPFFATKSHIVLRSSLRNFDICIMSRMFSVVLISLRNIEFADTTRSIFVIQRVQTKIALARAPSISLSRARTVSFTCTTDVVCMCVCVLQQR